MVTGFQWPYSREIKWLTCPVRSNNTRISMGYQCIKLISTHLIGRSGLNAEWYGLCSANVSTLGVAVCFLAVRLTGWGRNVWNMFSFGHPPFLFHISVFDLWNSWYFWKQSYCYVESNGSCKTAGKLISGISSMITESNNINVALSSTVLSIGWFSVFSAT